MAAIASGRHARPGASRCCIFRRFRTSHEVAKIVARPTTRCRPCSTSRRSTPSASAPCRRNIRSAARRRTRTFFQAARRRTLVRRLPGIVQQMHGRFAALTGRQYRLFDYVGAPDAGARHRADGPRAPKRAGNRWMTSAAGGEKVGVPEGLPVSPLVARRPARGAAGIGALHRRARLHHGSRRRRRTAVQGCAGRPGEDAASETPAFRRHAEGDRRPLWPRLQGNSPGHGRRRVRACGEAAQRCFHWSALRTM